jgi:hypothetical protein
MKSESPIIYHSKDMANVKAFADRRTGQKLHAPDLSIRGHRDTLYINSTHSNTAMET